MTLSPALQTGIKQKLSRHFRPLGKLNFHSVGGGSINDTYRIEFGTQQVFCKINSASEFPQLFIKEKYGLELIGQHGLVKVPLIIDCFETDDKQILLLEWIAQGERKETFWTTFGKQLAKLHQVSNAYFGLAEDNYMGSVPQSNHQHLRWKDFFVQERLQPIVKRCFNKEQLSSVHLKQFEKLYKAIDNIFGDEKPSLLHGDLWSGNFMCNQKREPVLIDPAVYYGHRSMDLAMSTLFGGFRQPFYDAYNFHFPLPPNYREQWKVCNLYPLLIHLHLFGSSYLSQIEHSLQKFS